MVVTIGIAWTLISSFFGLDRVSNSMVSLLIYCSLFGFGGAFISLLLSKFMAKWMAGAKVIDPNTNDPTLRHLVNRIHEMARKSGLPKPPEVAIYDSEDVNAFATGPTRGSALVAVSTGLLNAMSEDEVDGVLGHEIAHIANGDMVTLTLVTGVVNTFAFFFSRVLAGLIAGQVDEKIRPIVRFVVTIIGDLLFTLLGSIVVNYFSRRREFRADLGGATFSGKQNMIGALRRLQSLYAIPAGPSQEKDMMATMKISNRKNQGILGLFKTHPDLEDRIQALQSARI